MRMACLPPHTTGSWHTDEEMAESDGAHGHDVWCRDETGAWRHQTMPSMLQRLPGLDYRQQAIYQR